MAIADLPAKQRRQTGRSSLRTELFLETLTLLSVTVVVIAGTVFLLASNAMTGRMRSELQSIAQEKAAFLDATVSKQREQLSILSRDPTGKSLEALKDVAGFRSLLRLTPHEVQTLAGQANTIDDVLLQALRETTQTVFKPVVTQDGWMTYVVATPEMSDGVQSGVLAVVFDAKTLASRILHADYAGNTAEVLLSGEVDSIILRFDDVTGKAVPILQTQNATPLAAAFSGDEAVASAKDYAGIPVLEVYRRVPSIGWSVIAKVDRYEMTAPVASLALETAAIGLAVVLLLSLSTFALARRIVEPVEELTRKLDRIETRHWVFKRTIRTGNELEVVDEAADDLTRRLRAAYEHLEDLVRERTEDVRKAYAEDQAVLQSMDDGLIVTDEKGVITYINPTAERLTGGPHMKGKSAVDILKLSKKSGEPLPVHEHPVTMVLRTKARYAPNPDPELTLVGGNEKDIPIQIRGTPVLRGERSYGAVLVLRDITEERKVDTMKSEFISLVSHQLRTPLSAMRWYLEMLLSEDAGPLTNDQKEYLGEVTTSNGRMVHLVNALLNVSRIELGRFSLSPETIYLCDILKSVLDSFALELEQKGIKVEKVVPAKKIGVRSDKGLLTLVLENLMSNAIKYSPKNSDIRIRIQEKEDGKSVKLSVQDSGIGIPASQQKDIGRKLFRATNARTVDTDGNGLGLYISHIAAESIGAELHFESAEGKGTTFMLAVPIDQKSEKAI